MKRIAIIGGGISGLATAHRLIELSRETHQPLKLTILEASPRLGGTIQTEHRDGFLLEHGPDAFISEKPEALSLGRRLGIDSQIIETNQQHRRSFIVKQGRLLPVPEGFQLLAPSRLWPFITSDIFTLSGKMRMAADLFLPRRSQNGTDDESLASFVRRRFGREALDRMAQPMVGGIYTADPEVLSLRATLPRFLDMEEQDRSLILALWRKARQVRDESGVSGARYSLFLSFDHGMEVLVDALTKSIGGWGNAEVRLKSKVKRLDRSSTLTWLIRLENDETLEADAICLAVPSFVSATLLRNLEPTLAALLQRIRFASSATVNIAYKRSDIAHKLDGFGFVVPFIERRSLIACTFSSVKFSGRAPENCVLLRAFVGGALQPEMLTLDDTEMTLRVQGDLSELLDIKAKPLFSEVTRWTNSMPQYEVGHLDRISEVEDSVSRISGLELAGNSFRGAGIPDCVRSAERAAAILFNGCQTATLRSGVD